MEEMVLFDGGDVQMDRVSARILSRLERREESLALYRKLREQYPDNAEVWEDYIETLVNFANYDLALAELEKLSQQAPSSPRANRLEARIYYEQEMPEKTYVIYDKLLKTNPDDPGLWADYGSARLSAGDWQQALDCYSRALELKADNYAIIKSVHEILQKYRPRVETGYKMYSQADNTETATYSVSYRRYLGAKNILEFAYDRVSLHRTAGTAPDLALLLEKPGLTLRHQYDQQWQARAGLSPYSGLGDGAVALFGLEYAGKTYGASAVYEHHAPWYDESEAAARDGSYDRADLVLDRRFDRTWNINVDLGYRKYFLDDRQAYGAKRSLTAGLTKKVFERPDLSVSYAFSRTLFDYEDDAVQPVSMITSEAVHSLTGFLEHDVNANWNAFLYGGFRRDVVRDVDAWVCVPGIRLRMGDRVTGEGSYEYLSEAGNETGGKSTTLSLRLSVLF